MDKEEYKMNNFVLCQNETFNKFSVITWWSVSLLEETEYYKETANVVIFIWETGYWTRAIKRLALFDLLKSLYSDTKILSKYILSLQTITILEQNR
jgi:hypothetical protein